MSFKFFANERWPLPGIRAGAQTSRRKFHYSFQFLHFRERGRKTIFFFPPSPGLFIFASDKNRVTVLNFITAVRPRTVRALCIDIRGFSLSRSTLVCGVHGRRYNANYFSTEQSNTLMVLNAHSRGKFVPTKTRSSSVYVLLATGNTLCLFFDVESIDKYRCAHIRAIDIIRFSIVFRFCFLKFCI